MRSVPEERALTVRYDWECPQGRVRSPTTSTPDDQRGGFRDTIHSVSRSMALNYFAQAMMACANAIELFAKCWWFVAMYVSRFLKLVELASYFKIVTISLRIVLVLALGASESNFS